MNTIPIDGEPYAFGAGLFLTKNILLKAEYVARHYNDCQAEDHRNSSKCNGYPIQAVVGF